MSWNLAWVLQSPLQTGPWGNLKLKMKFQDVWTLHEWLSELIYWLQFTDGGSSIQIFFSVWFNVTLSVTDLSWITTKQEWVCLDGVLHSFNNILPSNLVPDYAWTHKEGQVQTVLCIRSDIGPNVGPNVLTLQKILESEDLTKSRSGKTFPLTWVDIGHLAP